ncbi:putative substrate-binding transport lipoprotein [Streptomyces scabiei 87.22]|uniref:Putative substrate-binding transport lipoprotein n=1 Tax=Streptomyces scabiei (strain 87.22) TaxID=680198 RepID=C9YYL7_STRSW|nr:MULTISPECIES: extracellular solute-binding protein [Streptomyces]MBP5859586.1 extracellular solute-binding protein [Streptomyces sp. LBUM 1484]MBP5871728.1 extracellular solute-binding protein [Streptomyces sp. LBUM 1485]MBP5904058.1 extracellular solute-binding protein [Streptomyces sp. LBUM 1488]MBP5912262.1 extracellular solute-binding protein [Streptomyces sp. LBUM 1486]MDX2536501.1 extracellular solute-binding protein [Streptomyces scabiei]
MPRNASTFASSAMSRRFFLTTTGALSLGAALTACGGGDDSSGSSGSAKPVSQADIDKAMKTPTELTFWTWVPNIAKEIALFEKKYPAVKIKVVNAGQGTPQYTKLRTALKAGSGAPDMVQIEYQAIPTFTITDSLLDLRPYGAAKLKDRFVDWTWGQVSGAKGEVWAIPQDTGPMGLLYRKDIFDKHGIDVPGTWDEFAEAARKLHKADPDVYLTNLAPSQPAAWHGLLWQAGAKPYTTSGKGDITISVDDAVSKKLGAYWGGLAKEGVVSTDPDFTDGWYAGLNKGKYATWITAAWGPAFLSGSAKATAGKWRAAPLPQWDAAKPSAGNWGGSTTAVIRSTKNPVAAAVFAQFLNSDPTTAKMFATEQFFFPATKALLADQDFVSDAPSFYGGQKVNQVFADVSATVDPSFQWPPFLDQAATDWTETVGKSLADKKDTVAALGQWQSRLTTYAKGQGFTVKGS